MEQRMASERERIEVETRAFREFFEKATKHLASLVEALAVRDYRDAMLIAPPWPDTRVAWPEKRMTFKVEAPSKPETFLVRVNLSCGTEGCRLRATRLKAGPNQRETEVVDEKEWSQVDSAWWKNFTETSLRALRDR